MHYHPLSYGLYCDYRRLPTTLAWPSQRPRSREPTRGIRGMARHHRSRCHPRGGPPFQMCQRLLAPLLPLTRPQENLKWRQNEQTRWCRHGLGKKQLGVGSIRWRIPQHPIRIQNEIWNEKPGVAAQSWAVGVVVDVTGSKLEIQS